MEEQCTGSAAVRAKGLGDECSALAKGQSSIRSSPALNILPPPRLLKKAGIVLGELVKSDDVTCSCMLHPRGSFAGLKTICVPLNISSLAQMRGSLSGGCHCI
jgi:hypothetical protein